MKKPAWLPAGRWLRLLLLLVPVLLAHLLLGSAVLQLQQGWRELAPMPPRMTAIYARELKAAVPRSAARPVAAKPAQAVRQRTLSSAGADMVPVAALDAALPAPVASAPADLLADLPPLPSGTAVEADGEPGPEWPASTRLNYSLSGNYRGAVTGQAQVEWLRQGRRYQVHLDLSVGPSFAPLITRRMSSDGLLGPRGIAPQRYDEETKIVFVERRRVTVLFQGDHLTLANGTVEAAPAGAQDASSQFVQLTWLFLTGREPLTAGHIVELPLVLPRRQMLWRYEVLGEEVLNTPFGPLATWHLRPTAAVGGGDLSAEVWLAPTLQYLPVRLLIRQDAQTFLDLMLSGPPLQEAGP